MGYSEDPDRRAAGSIGATNSAEATWFRRIGDTKVDEKDLVLRMVYHPPQSRYHAHPFDARQGAAKHRILDMVAIAPHYLKDLAKTCRVGNVVSHKNIPTHKMIISSKTRDNRGFLQPSIGPKASFAH